MTREELMRRLRSNLDLASSTGDLSTMLTPTVIGLADRLSAVVAADDYNAMYLIATTYWMRAMARASSGRLSLTGPEAADLRQAITWFSPVFVRDPRAVPPALYQVLAATADRAGSASHDWHMEAVRLLSAPTIGEPECVERAVRLLKDAVEGSPGNDPARPARLADLCDALMTRYELTDDPIDLAEVIEVGREAAATLDGTEPEFAMCLTNLGAALRRRAKRDGSARDLDAAVEVLRQILREVPRDHPDYPLFLTNLGGALVEQLAYTGDTTALDRGIALHRRAVATGRDHRNLSMFLTNIGAALIARYKDGAARADLDDAISAFRDLIPIVSGDERMQAQQNLLNSLLGRYDKTDDREDLDEAADLYETAFATLPDTKPVHSLALTNLSVRLRERFEIHGNPDDLERAVALGRRASAIDSRTAPLTAFGNALLTRFEYLGHRDDLDEAVDLLQRALVNGTSESEHAGLLANFSRALLHRYRSDHAPADLTAAVEAGRQAVAVIASAQYNHRIILTSLSNALLARYQQLGRIEDLDETVDLARRALAATTPESPQRCEYLTNLCAVLQVRFRRTGDSTDLDDAVDAGRAAVEAAMADHPGRPRMLSNLCAVLLERYHRHHLDTDLDDAVDAAGLAVDALPGRHPDRPAQLANLCAALLQRSSLPGHLDDLAEALRTGRLSAETASIDDHDRPGFLSNVGVALFLAAREAREPALLDEAINVLRQAAAAIPADRPSRATVLSSFGVALMARADLTGKEADFNAAAEVLAEGLSLESAEPGMRVQCGQRLGRAAVDHGCWVDADRAWRQVLDLLPLFAGHELRMDDRQHHLSELADVGPYAAVAAVQVTGPPAAWEALEQGRGVLLSQSLEIGSDTGLRNTHPGLAGEADRIRRILNAHQPEPTRSDARASDTAHAETRRGAARKWKRLLESIREKPGFERYGLSPTMDEMQSSVGDGTVVALAATDPGGGAFIMNAGGADHVPLPGLTVENALKHANAVLMRPNAPDAAARILRTTLAWLWDEVVEPVLNHLGHCKTPADGSWPRVWWMPTGALSVLPLHAAGHHDDPTDPQKGTVLDRVASSYTPTVRLLHRVRRISRPQDGAVVAVGIDDAPGHRPLTFAGAEAQAVASALGSGNTPLIGRSATRTAVLRALLNARWAHFACHGVTATDPVDSHLVLHDGTLPVRELIGLELPNAYLAYLSACTTGFGGTLLPDESIHIASAFLLAGYPHVIGTLWPMVDQLAPEFADRIYRELSAGVSPAMAVHHAVRHARDEYPGYPQLWATHMHFGA